MSVIPVLDLRGGIVVRAHLGRRDQYRPIETPLSATSDPVDVMRGLFSVHPFKTFYIADLDAITGSGNNDAVLNRLRTEFPAATFWVDNGVNNIRAARRWFDTDLGHLVVGSESQKDLSLLLYLSQHQRWILSLDFRDQDFQGPAQLLIQVELWPQRLIVMTLAQVGSGAGPDFNRLATIRGIAAGRQIYAAGGVRDVVDLTALKRVGIAGALVATSLHDGRLTSRDLESIEIDYTQHEAGSNPARI